MKPKIEDLNHFPIQEIYQLIHDIYSTSEGMSESLEEKYPTLETFEQEIIQLKARSGFIAITAELDGEPVGYLIIRPRYPSKLRHTADLNMGVKSSARGKGIGHLLLNEALEQAKNSPQLEIIYLMVRADNLAAVKLYQKAGFETLVELNRDTKINGTYYDGLFMRLFV